MPRRQPQGRFGSRLLRWFVVACALGLPGLQTARDAGAATTNLRVMARIASFFRMHVERQTPALNVTDADVARGYIDAPAATRFTVSTNSADAYVIEFVPQGEWMRGATVTGLPNAVEIGPQGGAVLFNLSHGNTTAHELSYRFALQPGLQPGSYIWPLQIAVHSA